MAIVKDTENR